MTCKVCKSKTSFAFSAKILKKYNIKYFSCPICYFLQTETPYWLEESYLSPISQLDVGMLSRNIHLSRITALVAYYLFNKNKAFLDYGGGFGIFTRLMRDIGFNFFWYDLFTKNLIAPGFEYNKNIENIELITCFKCFEHFSNPGDEIERLLSISPNILFTTHLTKQRIPAPKWNYYSLDTGQHISFFNIKTLQFIANKYNLHLNSNGNFLHLLSIKKISNLRFNFYTQVSGNKLSCFLKNKLYGSVEKNMSCKIGDDFNFLQNSIKKSENTL
jgi:hypothetical protein